VQGKYSCSFKTNTVTRPGSPPLEAGEKEKSPL